MMRKRERDIRLAFHQAGALDPTTARGLDDMAIAESRGFARLKSRDVIRESAPGCFYFDDETWQSVRSMRLKLALSILGAVALVAMLVLYAVSRAR